MQPNDVQEACFARTRGAEQCRPLHLALKLARIDIFQGVGRGITAAEMLRDRPPTSTITRRMSLVISGYPRSPVAGIKPSAARHPKATGKRCRLTSDNASQK